MRRKRQREGIETKRQRERERYLKDCGSVNFRVGGGGVNLCKLHTQFCRRKSVQTGKWALSGCLLSRLSCFLCQYADFKEPGSLYCWSHNTYMETIFADYSMTSFWAYCTCSYKRVSGKSLQIPYRI